jgi:hypothetical protein
MCELGHTTKKLLQLSTRDDDARRPVTALSLVDVAVGRSSQFRARGPGRRVQNGRSRSHLARAAFLVLRYPEERRERFREILAYAANLKAPEAIEHAPNGQADRDHAEGAAVRQTNSPVDLRRSKGCSRCSRGGRPI